MSSFPLNRICYLLLRAAVILQALQNSLSAQTLDEQYEFYLNDGCANLNFEKEGGPGTALLPGQAGPNLSRYCGGPLAAIIIPPGSTASTNSVGNAPSTGNGGDADALRRRNEELREDNARNNKQDQAKIDILSRDTFGFFLTVDSQQQNKDATQFGAASKADSVNVLMGLDKRFGASSVIGLAYSRSDLHGKTVGGGDFDREGNAYWVYGSWFPTDTVFFDINIGKDNATNKSRRLVERQLVIVSPVISMDMDPTEPETETNIIVDIPQAIVEGRTESDVFSFALSAGRDFRLERLTIGPRLSLTQSRSTIDAFTESGDTPMSLRFLRDTEKSLVGILGMQGSRAFPLSRGVLNLQGNINWQHEFKNKQRTLRAQFAEDLREDAPVLRFLSEEPDKDWITIGLSGVLLLPGGFSGFLSYEQSFSHRYLDRKSINIGIRQEF